MPPYGFGDDTPTFESYAELVASGALGPATVDGVALGADKNGPYAHGVNSGKILFIGDSLGINGKREGLYRSSGSMSGVSTFSIGQDATTGTAVLKYYESTGALTWTAPGDTEGDPVVVAYPQTLKIYSGDGASYLYCSVIPEKLPTSDTSVNQTIAVQSSSFYGSVKTIGADQGHIETTLRAVSQNGITIVNKSVGGIASSDLSSVFDGLVADPSEAENLRNLQCVLIEIGTNDMLGYGDADPTTWLQSLQDAILRFRLLAPVVVMANPMPALNDATKRLNAWKYYWKPLGELCRGLGARVIHPWEAAFGLSASSPDTGIIPDSAHLSAQGVWYGVAEILEAIAPARLYQYMPTEADIYNASTNPTGNILGKTTPSGTSGTAGTGGVATALFGGCVVERIVGAAATITATQESLGNVTAKWQKLTMAGAAAITEITRMYEDITPAQIPPDGTVLDGLVQLRIPAQTGLRRIGVRIEQIGSDGRMAVWENEKQTSSYPSLPPGKEWSITVPLEGMKVATGMTGVRVGIYLQTEIGATCSVYYRRRTLCPRA